jgi:hypothetical protein
LELIKKPRNCRKKLLNIDLINRIFDEVGIVPNLILKTFKAIDDMLGCFMVYEKIFFYEMTKLNGKNALVLKKIGWALGCSFCLFLFSVPKKSIEQQKRDFCQSQNL